MQVAILEPSGNILEWIYPTDQDKYSIEFLPFMAAVGMLAEAVDQEATLFEEAVSGTHLRQLQDGRFLYLKDPE